MKVDELRAALSERGLETTGPKAELIERLSTANADEANVLTTGAAAANKEPAADPSDEVDAAPNKETETTSSEKTKGAPAESTTADAPPEKRAAEDDATTEADESVDNPVKRARGSVDIDVSSVTSVNAQAALAAAFSLSPAASGDVPTTAAMVTPSTEQKAAEAHLGFTAPPPPLIPVLPPQTAQGGALGDTPVATTLVAPASGVCGLDADAFLAEVRTQYPDVTITVTPPQSCQPPVQPSETTVSIVGPFQDVHAAYSLVVSKAFVVSSTMLVKLLVANDEAAALIGKRGSTIAAIRVGLGGVPNCFRVLERDPANPTIRMATFTGDFVLAQKAHELVQDRLVAARNGDTSGPTFGQATVNAGAPGANLSGSSTGVSSGGGAGSQETQVQVPAESLGAVIGKGGSRINEIRQLSGAKVNIDSGNSGDQANRLVTIIGSPEAVEWAKYLLSVAMGGGEPSQSLGSAVPPGMLSGGNQGKGGSAAAALPQYSVAELTAAGYTPEQISAYMQQQQQQQQQQQGMSVSGTSSGVVVTLPGDNIGAVIGKGGCKINNMRSLSGAKVNLQEAVPGVATRTVKIDGDATQTKAAQTMLMAATRGEDVSQWTAFHLQSALQHPAAATTSMASPSGYGTPSAAAAYGGAAGGGFGGGGRGYGGGGNYQGHMAPQPPNQPYGYDQQSPQQQQPQGYGYSQSQPYGYGQAPYGYRR